MIWIHTLLTGVSKYQAVLSVVFIMALTGTARVRAESHLKEKSEVVPKGLILDLDADRGIKVVNGRVTSWKNQVDWKVKTFVATRDANHEKGTGHPKLKEKVSAIDGHNTVVFRRQELINSDEDAFDHLITGSGYTWFAVMSVYPQVSGLKDVNSFFGNLRNGGKYEGFWAGLKDDNTLWAGSRNGITFGRWDQNNPQLPGPKLKENRYYVIASRMGAGTGKVTIELFVNPEQVGKPVASKPFPVNPKANSSKMAIGQERDATNHPGHESFDGELARLLMWDRPLSNQEFEKTLSLLKKTYALSPIVYGHDWPMWRYDAGRRAASPEELPEKMHLQWVRELAPPKPAWPKSQYRLQFDASYEPVVAGKTIFVGSMVSDRVTAYDTETGIEKWRFYTDGPVRFAPVVYKDKLYFASDDGYLYCLNAENGSLIRKYLGGPPTGVPFGTAQNSVDAAPDDAKVIGNDRLIGMWPMRGGPVLYEGKIYFAASIWPFMGTFIHAIDAETGEAIWTNSGSGTTYIMQPHSSPAFAGVAPQGYLVATEEKLLVSGGRSVPAAYDRKTGRFLYYNMNEYGKTGACDVMASDDHFFNRGAIYRLSDGIVIPRAPASVIADGVIIGKRYNSIVAYKLEPGAKKAESLWQAKVPSELKRIFLKAGPRLYGSGEKGIILAVDIPLNNPDKVGKVSWQAKVEGEVWNMLAADGKLFVITLQGRLYCFADKRTRPKHHALEVKPLPAGSRQWKDKVRQILEMTDEREGYCLLLGLGTGELLYQLVNQSKLHIVALDPDAGKVEAIRRKLDKAGLYGTRVAVHVGDITTMRLPPYMANLVVSEDRSQKSALSSVLVERVFHSLRPYGGTACFLAPQSKHIKIMRQVLESKLPGSEITSSGNFIMLTRAGPLIDSADWTHQYGDSANTVMSRDKRVKAPLGLLWFGGPSNDKILPRHGHGPSPQVAAGRLFIEGRNMLRAVDVYTGRLLWERDFKDIGKYYDNTSHQPGANEIGSNYVSVSDAVYVVYGDKIHVLDPATGATTKEFSMPHEDRPRWGTIAVWEDLLLATASPIDVPLTDKPVRTKLPENMQPIIKKEADWQYLAGTHPNSAWTQPDFNTETWGTSAAGFGYNYKDNKTMLKDMKDHYTVVYVRKSFSIPKPKNIHELGLVINYDDAFIAYLNGKEILRVGVFSGSGARASDIEEHERKDWEYFKIDNHRSLLREGKNVLAIEGHNEDDDSRGFTLNPYLVVLRNGKPGVNRNIEFAGLNNISGITVNADYSSGSKMLVAMNRHSGEALWKRDAEFSFRHNAIAMAANKIFCIDGMSTAKLAYFKRRGLNFEKERTLYALDACTGELLWKTNEGVFGTWLGYSVEHDVLLQAGSRSGDRARDEAGKGMVAYRGSDGKVLWMTDESYKGPNTLPQLGHNTNRWR